MKDVGQGLLALLILKETKAEEEKALPRKCQNQDLYLSPLDDPDG